MYHTIFFTNKLKCKINTLEFGKCALMEFLGWQFRERNGLKHQSKALVCSTECIFINKYDLFVQSTLSFCICNKILFNPGCILYIDFVVCPWGFASTISKSAHMRLRLHWWTDCWSAVWMEFGQWNLRPHKHVEGWFCFSCCDCSVCCPSNWVFSMIV